MSYRWRRCGRLISANGRTSDSLWVAVHQHRLEQRGWTRAAHGPGCRQVWRQVVPRCQPHSECRPSPRCSQVRRCTVVTDPSTSWRTAGCTQPIRDHILYVPQESELAVSGDDPQRTRVPAGSDFGNSAWAQKIFSPRGMPASRSVCANFFLKYNFEQNDFSTCGTNFHQLFIVGRYLIVDYRFDSVFSIAQGTLSWQPFLGSKLAKSDYSTFIRNLDIPKRIAISSFWF